MHVIHIVRDLEKDSGGLTRAVVQLVEALSEQGTTVTVCYQDRGGETVDVDPSVRRIPIAGRNTFERVLSGRALLKALTPILDEGGPIVFHMHGLWDDMTRAAAKLTQRKSIPYIWSIHGMLEPWVLQQGKGKTKKSLALSLFQRKSLANASRVHVTAEMEGQNVSEILPNSKLIIAPNGIPPTADPNPKLRQQSPKVAMFLSRIHPKKGLELLIEAWSRLNPSDWVCEIVGPGDEDYIAELERLIRSKNLESVLRFFPPLEDHEKWAAYQRSSLFVLPTYSENFGIVVAEALAMGTPVLTTTGTPWSTLVDHDCGWYIDPDVDDLTEALGKIFKTELSVLENMGRRGRVFATENFEWGAIGQQFISCYSDCLKAL